MYTWCFNNFYNWLTFYEQGEITNQAELGYKYSNSW